MQSNGRVDLRLPAELHRPTPRPLPRDFGYNFHNLKRKQRTIHWAGAGIFCMVLHFVPFVKAMGFYFWPFLILFWVGLLLCVIGAVFWFKQSKIKRAENYVKHAEVAFAEVRELIKIPVSYYQGRVAYQAYAAELTLENPETGRKVEVQVKSDDFPFDEKLSPKFRVGDHVPIVWHKNEFNSSLQIYDFIEATPDSAFQRPPISLLRTIFIMAMSFAGIFLIAWSANILDNYGPIEFGFSEALIPVSIGIAIGLIWAIPFVWVLNSRRKAVVEKNELAISTGEAFDMDVPKDAAWQLTGFYLMSALGLVAITTCVFMAVCFAVNASLDKSPVAEERVRITDMVEITHQLLLRQFYIEYEMEGVDGERRLTTTPKHIATFQDPVGMAQVHDGYFGWRWVETIKPIGN